MGKSRVTPKNTISIPRLELSAATVSVKIGDVLKDQLEYENFEDHYWVVGGNSMIRQFISKCVTCRYLRGIVGVQKMADLPKSRVEPAPPIIYCGVDFFGPWHVFTCFASRAVHIEVADSLETDSFIQALRWFICR